MHLHKRPTGRLCSQVHARTTSRFFRVSYFEHGGSDNVLVRKERLEYLSTSASADEPTTSASSRAVLDRSAGRMTYKPLSYGEMVTDAVEAVLTAIDDGVKWLEVEFPALPTNIDGMRTKCEDISILPISQGRTCGAFCSGIHL